jgi:hypothetical protein
LGPRILIFIPEEMVPANTLPNAKNLPLSLLGTILEMYITRGPLGSQVLMAVAVASSMGPV